MPSSEDIYNMMSELMLAEVDLDEEQNVTPSDEVVKTYPTNLDEILHTLYSLPSCSPPEGKDVAVIYHGSHVDFVPEESIPSHVELDWIAKRSS